MARNTSTDAVRPTRHVVMRYNWRAYRGSWRLTPGLTRLASFETAVEAEADRAERETNARRRINPFRCGDLAALTTMPEGVFHDLMTDLTLTPPVASAKGEADWVAWWEGVAAPAKVRLWAAFDKLHFYAVRERPDRPIGYAVLSLNWQYNDEFYFLNDEGGSVREVYRTRERAVQAAKYLRTGSGDRENYFPASADPLDPEVHFRLFEQGTLDYDIVEVELEGLS